MLTINQVGDHWSLSSSDFVLSGIQPDSKLHPATTTHLQASHSLYLGPFIKSLRLLTSFPPIHQLPPASVMPLMSAQSALVPMSSSLVPACLPLHLPDETEVSLRTPATRLFLIPLGSLPHAHAQNLHFLEFVELPGIFSWCVSPIFQSPSQPFQTSTVFFLCQSLIPAHITCVPTMS